MSDLDKKLDELFSELITDGTRIPMAMLDIHAKMGHPFMGQKYEAWQGREMAKWYVKQAFKDAGEARFKSGTTSSMPKAVSLQLIQPAPAKRMSPNRC